MSVPDPNTLRDAVRRSTFGHLSEHPNLSDTEITRRIANRFGTHDPADTFRILNYVRGARRAYEEGERAERAPDPTAPFVPRATDPALQGEMAEYRYRTVVEIIDPRTGNRYATVVPVDSTVPLSPQQIREEAAGAWQSIRGPDRYYVDRAFFGADANPTVTITGGGRRE